MQEYLTLLKNLIRTPSPSGREDEAAAVIRSFLSEREVGYFHKMNNTWALNRYFDPSKPVILLNSHIDTVNPVPGWQVDPYTPVEEGNRITGLGSNDAGGPLVALLALFLHFTNRHDLPWNLIWSATAEEEISGGKGIVSILGELPEICFAVVGEPTAMQLAIAEKGLMVIDCTAAGKAGHAARDEGENAIYKALRDIQKIMNFRFGKVSELLGPVKITITQIEAGTQHNVIPDVCRFVLDVRTNEFYSNKEVLELLSGIMESSVSARSFRLNSSRLSPEHPFVVRAGQLGIRLFGSPTTSDQAVISSPSVKIGPGDSARSHTAGEYIYTSEICDGINLFIELFEGLYL